MRRFRSCLMLAALVGAGLGVAGATPAATAYCEAEPAFAGPGESGSARGCSNSCTRTGDLMAWLGDPFWMCPQ